MGEPTVVVLTIGGFDVVGHAFGEHSWPARLGVAAPEVVWALPPNAVAGLLAIQPNSYGARETSYTITAPNGLTRSRQRVIVLREAPSNDPLIRYVVLTDVRWYLTHMQDRAVYNLRIPSGATRLVNTEGSPINTASPVNVLTYSPITLRDGRAPWTADQILVDVTARFTARFGIQFVAGARSRGNYTPNNVQLEGDGTVLLAQALGWAGGIDVTVNRAGAICTVNGFQGAEALSLTSAMGYSIDGHGTMTWVTMSGIAPPVINCKLVREIEVRGDGWEQVPPGATTAPDGSALPAIVPVPVDNNPTFEFVTPVTDPELAATPSLVDATGAYTGETYTSNLGSLLQEDQYYAATRNDTVNPPIASADLTWNRQTMCLLYLGGSMLDDVFANDPAGSQPPNGPWSGRVSHGKAAFHTLLRLNRNFATLCYPGSIKPVRAQMLDAANQTRAKSQAFCDYAQKPSLRGMAQPNSKTNPAGWNINSWPSSDASFDPQAPGFFKNYGPAPGTPESFPNSPVPLSQLQAAPMEVGVPDPIQGIFQLSPKTDPWGYTAEIAPGMVNLIPTVDNGEIEKNDNTSPFWQDAVMLYTHRIAIVFTATPLGPNGEGQFHIIPVTAAQALVALGVSATSVKASGPPLDLRLRDQNARIPWADSQRVAILSCFTGPQGAAAPDELGAAVGAPGMNSAQNPGAALIPVNSDELTSYATAAAAVYMAAMLDHFEGTATIGWSPDVTPLGALHEVTETVDSEGCIWTTFHCSPVVPPIKPEHFMSQAARAQLFGNLGQGGK